MSKVYRSVLEVCWALGLISLVLSVVLKPLPILQVRLGVSPRGGIILAAVLFLCVLATGEARKTPPSS
jgi:uncharacterized membrane protein YkvI